MTAPSRQQPAYVSAAGFRAALLGSGLLVETRTRGVYHRSGGFEEVLQALERYAAGTRAHPPAARRWFPPVMSREDFLRTDYLRSFPDLIGSVDVFAGGDAAHRALLARLDEGADDWTSVLEPSEMVLSSSACHSLYGTLAPQLPAEGLLVECSGFAFRHEPSLDPARMQSFRMFEFVRIGTPAQARQHRDEWVERGRAALERLGLAVRVEAAHDPFFGRAGRLLAATQRAAGLKDELVLDLHAERPTAVASSNYHEDHFGTSFALTTPDEAPAHSACFGYGLERITLALLAVHGLDPDAWPEEVRGVLAC